MDWLRQLISLLAPRNSNLLLQCSRSRRAERRTRKKTQAQETQPAIYRRIFTPLVTYAWHHPKLCFGRQSSLGVQHQKYINIIVTVPSIKSLKSELQWAVWSYGVIHNVHKPQHTAICSMLTQGCSQPTFTSGKLLLGMGFGTHPAPISSVDIPGTW